MSVQARILHINSREFFILFGCHKLNLVRGNAAKCSSKAMAFFGIIQRIYMVFAACRTCEKY